MPAATRHWAPESLAASRDLATWRALATVGRGALAFHNDRRREMEARVGATLSLSGCPLLLATPACEGKSSRSPALPGGTGGRGPSMAFPHYAKGRLTGVIVSRVCFRVGGMAPITGVKVPDADPKAHAMWRLPRGVMLPWRPCCRTGSAASCARAQKHRDGWAGAGVACQRQPAGFQPRQGRAGSSTTSLSSLRLSSALSISTPSPPLHSCLFPSLPQLGPRCAAPLRAKPRRPHSHPLPPTATCCPPALPGVAAWRGAAACPTPPHPGSAPALPRVAATPHRLRDRVSPRGHVIHRLLKTLLAPPSLTSAIILSVAHSSDRPRPSDSP